jgi:hypothetical protein
MKRISLALLASTVTAGLGWAQTPMPVAPMPTQPTQPMAVPGVQKPVEPKKVDPKAIVDEPPPPVTIPAVSNRQVAIPSAAFAAGTSFTRSSQPNVYGNFHGITNTFTPYLQAGLPNDQHLTILPGQIVTVPVGTVFNRPVQTQPITQIQTVQVIGPNGTVDTQLIRTTVLQVVGLDPIAHGGGLPVNVVRGGFKIAENESPRPTDRIYATYHFYSNVNPSLLVPGLSQTDVHRETLGIEKTLFDGHASIGLRLPLLQINGPANIQGQGLGDLTAVFKYTLINDTHDCGDGSVGNGLLLSTGLAVTVPTGDTVSYNSRQPKIHSTLLQPYLAAIVSGESMYLQGFTSIAVPTHNDDTTYFFNSLQVGYYLYRDSTCSNWIRSVTPIVECHVDTPLNNRGLRRLPIGAIDTVSITTGATLGLGRSAFLNLGCNVPLTGPKPYDFEALAQLNWKF